MTHLNAIQAGIKGKAPIVAIPVEGHAPVCIRREILKRALKGVSIETISIKGDSRWLIVRGTASEGRVRTCSKFAPIARATAILELSKWADKQRERAKKVLLMGDTATRKDAKEFVELRRAESQVIAITQAAKAHGRGESEDVSKWEREAQDERRAILVVHYPAFHHCRNRKPCHVIMWQLRQLKGEWRTAAKFNPNRRKSTARPFLEAKQAAKVIALVSRIVFLKSELDRLAPAIVPHPRFEYEWAAINPLFRPAKEREPYRAEYSRENLARDLREARQTIQAFHETHDAPVGIHLLAA